jgi:esterase/lipase superfamily enzyme
MGNWVTVEAFRQIRISGDLPPVSKIGTIVLAAPDIDIDVFKAQLRRFGKPQKPFYVVLSQDDRALFLSRTIAGGVTRVGDSTDTAELTALGATVIDLTDVKATDATNHDKFVQLASVGPELHELLAQGINTNHRVGDASERAVSGVGSVVALPLSILGAPVKILAGQ